MKILLFGATGTAGGAVLQSCMDSPAVTELRVIVRRSLDWNDPKLWELVHSDYADYTAVREAFRGVDACFFCLGVSVTQVSEKAFIEISHDYPLAAAKRLKIESPGAQFHYLSGKGTRAGSRAFWARVKAGAEKELIDLVGATCWRPAYIDATPSPGLPKIYAKLRPVLQLLKPFDSLYVAGDELGRAMLEATKRNLRGSVIENPRIRELAAQFTD